MGNLTELEASNSSKLVGRDELHAVDVIQENGANKMLVKASVVPEGLGNIFFLIAKDGTSENMAVNGGGTPKNYLINAESGVGAKDLVVREMRFYGFGNGIKLEKFLSLNSALTNGVLVEITSNGGEVSAFQPIKRTVGFDHKFSFGDGGKFFVTFSSGGDYMSATFSPRDPFILKKDTADKIKITIQDNISQVTELGLLAFGFRA